MKIVTASTLSLVILTIVGLSQSYGGLTGVSAFVAAPLTSWQTRAAASDDNKHACFVAIRSTKNDDDDEAAPGGPITPLTARMDAEEALVITINNIIIIGNNWSETDWDNTQSTLDACGAAVGEMSFELSTLPPYSWAGIICSRKLQAFEAALVQATNDKLTRNLNNFYDATTDLLFELQVFSDIYDAEVPLGEYVAKTRREQSSP
eukprot:CAMPEP_0198135262 /NCGR_PEP_ID=MMETSP1442-20131203/60497_1 /TAXON_ID= /ORGANISM="Craspedostauros australis, Strain CCMP3328" /LENGTH=205 /DNA_ID=CAMNT_0043796425 /DNA_START=703 /DNA_END=1320 /DNA_ORIENTATION=-